MQKSLLQFVCCLAVLLGSMTALNAQVTLRVVQTPTYYTPLIDPIHAAGSFNAWDPGSAASQMTKNPDGSFSIVIAGTPGQVMEYKYVRGDWPQVETQLNGAFLPNRSFTFQNGLTISDTIQNWDDQLGAHTAVGNTHILTIAFDMPQLGRSRQVWVYLPQDYYQSTDSFPVLYMHDGQNLFDEVTTAFGTEWSVDEAMKAREDSGYSKIIVVGIDNGGNDRINEYSPWVNAQYGGGQGDAYMLWLVNNLKPFIDSYFRTKRTRENTGLMGSSLGALISHYGGLQYQNVFSKIGIFSPSYWFSDACYTHARLRGHQAPMRIYHCAGGQESSTMVPKMYAMRDTLLANGFAPAELRTIVKADGQHSEWFWAREFGEAVKWLFQPIATGDIASPQSSSLVVVPSVVGDSFLLDLKGRTEKIVRLNVVSSEGKAIFEGWVEVGQQIDCSTWATGVYLLIVETSSGPSFQKMVVSR